MNRRKRESVSVGPGHGGPPTQWVTRCFRKYNPFPSRDFKQTTQNRTHDIHTQNESLYDDNGATKYPTDGTASRFGRLIEALEFKRILDARTLDERERETLSSTEYP